MRAFCVAALVLAVGCTVPRVADGGTGGGAGGGGGADGPRPGRTIVSSDQRAYLWVPDGGAPGDVVISVEPMDGGYRLSPSGLVFDPPALLFVPVPSDDDLDAVRGRKRRHEWQSSRHQRTWFASRGGGFRRPRLSPPEWEAEVDDIKPGTTRRKPRCVLTVRNVIVHALSCRAARDSAELLFRELGLLRPSRQGQVTQAVGILHNFHFNARAIVDSLFLENLGGICQKPGLVLRIRPDLCDDLAHLGH